jgi:hypothetical protein
MTRTRFLRTALLCALVTPAPALAQRFYAVASGEDPARLVQMHGTAYVCDYSDTQFMVLSDSGSARGITFLFHRPTTQSQQVYVFGLEEDSSDVFAEYIPVDRSEEVLGDGSLTLDALGPQGMHGHFTLTGSTRGTGRRVIVTGEITARSLGFLPSGTHCNLKDKQEHLRTLGWPAATVQAVLANEVSGGMTQEMVLESWGLPRTHERQRTAEGSLELWTYPNASVTLQNGRVSVIRD